MRKSNTITKRVTNAKGHTVGYVVNNNEVITRSEAAKAARNGKVKNAIAKKGRTGWYVQAPFGSDRTLYDLPTVVR